MDGHLSPHLHGKTVHAITGGIKMLLSPRTLKSLNSIEKIQPRIMVGTFNISCYNPTNASDEMNLITFYNKLFSLVHSIPKHVIIIGGDMNAQISKDENNKFCWHNSSNRNAEYLINFSLENGLTCLKTKLRKKKGKLWTYTCANNAKAQINKKWIISTFNYEAYSSFEGVFSNHRIVTAKICLSLCKQSKPYSMTGPCLTIEIFAVNI